MFISCTYLNSCTLTFDQTYDRDADNDRTVHFYDEGDLTLTASSDNESVGVMPSSDGKSIVITGRSSTESKGMNRFVEEGVTVTVTATDGGDLTAERHFEVVVNAAPVAGAFTVTVPPLKTTRCVVFSLVAAGRGRFLRQGSRRVGSDVLLVCRLAEGTPDRHGGGGHGGDDDDYRWAVARNASVYRESVRGCYGAHGCRYERR